MTKFLVSDTHFLHDKVIQYMRRPYKDSDEMTEAIIAEWNSVVKEEDQVFHLGDFAFGQDLDKIKSIIERLNGRLTIIQGNHDTPHKVAMYTTFVGVKVVGSINLDGYLMTHYPIHPSLLEERTPRSQGCGDWWNIHGHLHRGCIDDPRYYNMCFDVIKDGRHIIPFAEVKQRIQAQIDSWAGSAGGTSDEDL